MARKTAVEDAVTNSGAADLVGVTEGAIRHAIREGKLRPTQTADGKVALLPVEQVRAWASKPRSGRGRPRKSDPPKTQKVEGS